MTDTRKKPFTHRFPSCMVVADIHLEGGATTPASFARLLDTAGEGGHPLFVLGDMLDLWFDSRRLARRYENAFALVRSFTGHGGRAFFIPGNRDFLTGKLFAEKTGFVILDETADVEIGGTRYRLLHGDQIFVGDRNYHVYRRLVRNPLVRRILLATPDGILRGIAALLRRDPRLPEEDREIPLDRGKFRARVYDPTVFAYICGHVHRRMHVEEEIAGRQVNIYTLNAWLAEPEYILINGGKPRYHRVAQ